MRIVKLLSRRPFLSPENAKRFLRGDQEDMNCDGTPVGGGYAAADGGGEPGIWRL